MKEREQELEKSLRRLFPLYDHIGLSVESASAGVYKCRVPLNKQNSNHFQTVHAALQWASAEVLGGLVIATSGIDLGKYLGVVKSFHIEFRKPATSTIVAETRFSDSDMKAMLQRLKAHGRCDFELETCIRDETGNPVAQGHGVYAIRPIA